MNKLLNLKLIFIYYFIFIFVLMLFIKYHINVIHLEPNVVVKTKIANIDVEVSGPFLQEMLQSGLGDAAIFSVGARIALALVSKQSVGLTGKLEFL